MYVTNSTIEISRLRFLSAIPEVAWVTQRNRAGTSNAIALKAIKVALIVAAARLNFWLRCLSPPARMLAPSTRRMLPRIDPVSDALTTSVRPARRPWKAMIISAAFPNVAFNSPPIPAPIRSDKLSVALPIQPASGIIASPLRSPSHPTREWDNRQPGGDEGPNRRRVRIVEDDRDRNKDQQQIKTVLEKEFFDGGLLHMPAI